MFLGFPVGSGGKESAQNVGDPGLMPGLGRGMANHSSILPGEFHGQRSLRAVVHWGHKESDMTEKLPLSLSWYFQ